MRSLYFFLFLFWLNILEFLVLVLDYLDFWYFNIFFFLLFFSLLFLFSLFFFIFFNLIMENILYSTSHLYWVIRKETRFFTVLNLINKRNKPIFIKRIYHIFICTRNFYKNFLTYNVFFYRKFKNIINSYLKN